MQSLTRPKYLQFAEEVRQRVRAGELKPGDRLPSLSEARRHWGIGRSTLERAHAVLEKDGLIARQHGRGTFITHPRRATTGCIGFCRDATHHSSRYPYWSHLIEGMQAAAARAGLEVLLFNPGVDAVRWEKVDAVITLGAHLQQMRHQLPVTMPCVALLNRVADVPSVVADEYSGVYAAVHHLASLGHRRIGYLTFKDSSEAALRLAAYRTVLSEAGVEAQAEWVWNMKCHSPQASVSFVDLGRHNMREWLQHDWEGTGCTALMMQNDETALGAVEALREAGIKVPEEVAIVGFDGTEVAEYCSPPLTTVVMPLHEMGEKAVELLLLQMEESDATDMMHPVPHTLVLPTRLRVRETTPTTSLLTA